MRRLGLHVDPATSGTEAAARARGQAAQLAAPGSQRRPPRRDPPLPARFFGPVRALGRAAALAGFTLRPPVPLPLPLPLAAPLPLGAESVVGWAAGGGVCRTWVSRCGPAGCSGSAGFPLSRLVSPPPDGAA